MKGAKKDKASKKAASNEADTEKTAKSENLITAGGSDAEALLKADHRKVEELFEQYKEADEDEKSDLAKQICSELIVHTTLEEEIFYPACREKDVDDEDLDEAQVEHDGAKVMIAELMNGSPSDDYYDAKVTVRVHQASCR